MPKKNEKLSIKGLTMRQVLARAIDACIKDPAYTATEKLPAITEAVKTWDQMDGF